MKKIITIFLAFSIFLSTNFIAPKSHAVVGLIFKSKVVKVIGGISSGTGAGLAGTGFVVAVAGNNFGTLILGLMGIYGGLILGAVGLVILDDKTVADIEFVPLTQENALGFDQDAVAVYNSELEELNAVRKTIQAETSDAKGFAESKTLWNIYKANLSDETVAIAESQATHFMQELNNAL